MTIVALLSAQLEAPAGSAVSLAALTPIVGTALLERQAQAALRHGVTTICILVDALPPELNQIVDRLRAGGASVALVRNGADIAKRITASDRLVLVAEAMHAPDFAWETIVTVGPPTAMTVADQPATMRLERIDADHRWAGLAVLSGDTVGSINDIPDDWDPLLTLFRSLVQGGASLVPCDPLLFERGDFVLVADDAGAELVADRVIANINDEGWGFVGQHVFAPVARGFVRLLLAKRRSGELLLSAALLLPLAAMVAVWFGFAGTAFAVVLVASAAAVLASVICAFRVPQWPWGYGQQAALLTQLAFVPFCGWAAGRGEAPIGVAAWITLALTGGAIIIVGQQLVRQGGASARWVPDVPVPLLCLSIAAVAGDWRWGLIAFPTLAAALLFAGVRAARRAGSGA